jgi:hypothetical protein
MQPVPVTRDREDRTRIVLVTSPILTEHSDSRIVDDLWKDKSADYTSPPLGTLVVASLFRRCGWAVQVVDSNYEYREHLGHHHTQSSFARRLAERLSREESPYYGFSTICSSYPFSLRIAEHLKDLAPHSTIILGGPQASATATETLRSCSYIDFVVCGEVEDAIGPFTLSHTTAPASVPGLCWRDSSGVHLNPSPPPPDVSRIPFPAYDLWRMDQTGVVPVEAGRGCPFGCRFCSTSSFFGRSHRLRSPAAIIDDVLHVRARYAVETIALVHDNLFLTERDCEDFCAAWTSDERLKDLTWTCSLRPDVATPRMAQALSEAGCNGIFVGLETGSSRLQESIGKRIDLARAMTGLSSLHAAGIRTATSFIVGFPDETDDDLRETCALYLRMLRAPLAKPQVSVLAVLARSGYDAPSEWPLDFGGPMSSIAHQGSSIPSDLLALIDSSAILFSSHHAPRLRHLDRSFITECEYFLRYTAVLYRWLVVMMAHCMGDDLLSVLKLWWAFVRRRGSRASLFDYYSGPAFRGHFNEFGLSLPGVPGFSSYCVDQYRFLLDVYGSAGDDHLGLIQTSCSSRREDFAAVGTIEGNFVPRAVEYSFRAIIGALAEGGAVDDVRRVPSRLLCCCRDQKLVWEEPTPLTVAILEHLPSRRLVSDLVRELSDTCASALPAGLQDRRDEAFLLALKELCALGVLRSAPLRVLWTSEATASGPLPEFLPPAPPRNAVTRNVRKETGP